MRRPRGHIQQRSEGSFRLRYTLGRDPATGKRRTATATVRGTRKDAERELTRLLRTIDTSEHVGPNRLTVRTMARHWLDTVRAEISPKAHERYEEIVRSICSRPWKRSAENHAEPNTRGAQHLGLNPARWQTGGLAPRTRRYIHVILKSALDRAVEQPVLARNPAEVFRAPRIERQEMSIPSTTMRTPSGRPHTVACIGRSFSR